MRSWMMMMMMMNKTGLNSAQAQNDSRRSSSSGSSDAPEPSTGPLFSETSAFTAVAPKQNVTSADLEAKEEERSGLTKLFAGLDSTVTELIGTLQLVRQRKDAELQELQSTV